MPRPAPPLLPPVIGHRGAAAYAPENTLAGFRRAAALGCRWIEFDIRLTSDGALVVCHDSRLERTSDGRGRVATHSLAEIRECDAGSWFAPGFAGERMPSLDETLALAAELDLGANIEIKADPGKAPATVEALASVLGRYRGRCPAVLVSSFLEDALAACRELIPATARGLLLQKLPRDWHARAEQLGCATIHVAERRLDAALIAAIDRVGYRVLAYTVNDPRRAQQLFAWGVTSVFSDAPDIILAGVAQTRSARPDVAEIRVSAGSS